MAINRRRFLQGLLGITGLALLSPSLLSPSRLSDLLTPAVDNQQSCIKPGLWHIRVVGKEHEIGWITPWPQGVGWFPCDGRALSKRRYMELYSRMGEMYGETKDTFNLPDMRGMVVL